MGAGANTASQEFLPQGRRVINRGQVAGEAVTVTAEGTYEPQVCLQRCSGYKLAFGGWELLI